MLKFFNRINDFFRNLLLEDVDKQPKGPLAYHKKFGSVQRQKADIKKKRAKQRRQQSRGF